MQAAGINTILTYTIPPQSMFDQLQQHGLRAIVTVPWNSHVGYLDHARSRNEVLQQVKEGVVACREHPAVLMYCVAKEMYPPMVRWYGRKKVQGLLQDLCSIAKEHDPESLVTYTNYPTTEYLDLDFVDVFTFNVYLHQRNEFCKYLARLQHIAREVPFVLTEFGQCSHRHGRQGQAEFLDWQLEEIFDHGLAGGVVFGWTDPFFQNGMVIDEWGFGLVDADRNPKPSYDVVKRRYTSDVPFARSRKWPKISVVVALHNAAATLDDCLSSLQRLNYPDYEVIVVNDGSTDDSQSIIDQYPFRSIQQPQGGVSAARNSGLYAATGDIVAYIDSDARAERDWLRYLATTYLESNVSGVGGPNPVPEEDAWMAHCVYRSPGGPTEVMLDDQRSEHVPGCNMSFYRHVLEEIGGFDPVFTKAGDDVDICWRVIEAGHDIGFNPSALVWHHRRPSLRAYWRQQVGYGESESLLERKYPHKFNPWGHTAWHGHIYAPYPVFRLFGRPTIYYGLWGTAGFQSLYERGGQGMLSYLPRAMEFHAVLLALAFLGVFFPWMLVGVGAGVAYLGGYAITCALRAKTEDLERVSDSPTRWDRFRWRTTLAILHLIEPLARDWGRLKGGLTPWRSARTKGLDNEIERLRRQHLPWFGRFNWEYIGDLGADRDSFLSGMMHHLTSLGCATGWNPEGAEWDLRVRRGGLGQAHLRMVLEYLDESGQKRRARITGSLKQPKETTWIQLSLLAVALIMLFLDQPLAAGAAVALLVPLVISAISQINRLDVAIRLASQRVIADWEPESD
jgi:glycosyltransferase involved in cell wall biosynthesis